MTDRSLFFSILQKSVSDEKETVYEYIFQPLKIISKIFPRRSNSGVKFFHATESLELDSFR